MYSPNSGDLIVILEFCSWARRGRKMISKPNSDLGGMLKAGGLKLTLSVSETSYSFLISTGTLSGFSMVMSLLTASRTIDVISIRAKGSGGCMTRFYNGKNELQF